MSTEIQKRTETQMSLYDPVKRTVDYWFDIPESGINKDTGIMLFIGGYGATAQSNVFKKMRSLFSDRYNLITVQCNYFGHEYMWVPGDIVGDLKKDILSEKSINELSGVEGDILFLEKIRGKEFRRVVSQNESPSLLNDMGPVQAMDNLVVLHSLDRFLSDNGIMYDKNRVITFGNSHGAYIAELCNSYMPGVFSAIIDVGGYIYPYYLNLGFDRKVTSNISDFDVRVITVFDDLIKHIVMDREIYDLNALFSDECSLAKVVAFHGEEDFLTPASEKREYIHRSDTWQFNLITEKDVDNEVFFSNEHNLGANFIKLIELTFEKYSLRSEEERMRFGSSVFETDTAIYTIDTVNGKPEMNITLTGSYDRDLMWKVANSRIATTAVSEHNR